MKKLRVFVLAALGLVLLAGSAFAATKTWVGDKNTNPTERNTWGVAANWSPAGVPAEGDNILFTSGAVVTLADTDLTNGTEAIKDITVNGVNSNVELMLTAGSILHLDGSTFDIANGATLTFSGSGYVAIKPTGVTLDLLNQGSTINFNTVIAATGLPNIGQMAPRSRIAFTNSVNPSGIADGTGQGCWPAPIDWHVDNATATLSVTDNSQIQSSGGVAVIRLSGIFEVAGTISTNGDRTNIQLLGTGNPSGATGDPTVNVLADCSFVGAGGKTKDTNDVFRALTPAEDYRLTKKGPGSLTIAGSAKGAGYGLAQLVSDVFLYEGNLTFRRGAVAAFAPNNGDPSRQLTRFHVIDGHLTFANDRAVEPRAAINQATRIFLDLSGGKTTMYARSIGSGAGVTPAVCGNEAYPNLAKAQTVNFPFPTAVNVASGATLEIKGNQAFQQISGAGSIMIDSGASLILTDQSRTYDANPVYFTGPVSGAGSVAFAARTDELTGLPVVSQIYPFTNATYTGDTIVYGKGTQPYGKDGILLLSENSNLGKSALYLRSVKPGKNGGSPSDKVGSLGVVRLAGPSRTTRNVAVRQLKLDGSTIANNAPTIDIGSKVIDPNGGPGAEDFTGYMEEGNKFSQVLAAGSVQFAANSSEFSVSKYKKVFTLNKRGPGTLFAYGPGSGGTGDNSDDAIAVEEGMLWFYNTKGIGNNQVRVAPDAVLRVANGTTLPSHVKFDDETARLITEVFDSNLNNGSNAYAVIVNGEVKRGGSTLYGGVDLGDTIFGGLNEDFNYGYGYRILQQSKVFHDRFDAQKHTQLHGIVGGKYGTHKNTLPMQGVGSNRWFLTGWMETPDTGLKFGSLYSVTAPVLEPKEVSVAEDTFFNFEVKILHNGGLKKAGYQRPYVDLLAGSVSSLGIDFVDDTTLRVQGNINKRNPVEGTVDDTVAGIITIHLVPNPKSVTRGLPAQRTYVLTYGNVTPDPVVETVESKSVLAIDSASMSLAEAEDLILRMAATDIGIDESGKITQMKDADGNMVAVSNVKVKIGSTEISNYTAKLVGGAWQITVPATSVPSGTNAVSLTGTLADGKTIVTKSGGNIVKTTTPTPETPTPETPTPETPTPETPTTETPTTPSDDGGSGGGCDVGFGALSIAIAAAFLLRKKD